MKPTYLFAAMALAVAAFSLTPRGAAQSANTLPAHNSVSIIHLKPDMLDEWIDLEKNEAIPAWKKGGLPSLTTYHTVRGNPFEYVIAAPFDKYAQFDGDSPVVKALGAAGAARLGAKIRKCEESVQTFVSTPLPELSNTPVGEIADIYVSSRYRVNAGHIQEYQDFIKSELLPLYKKAGQRFVVNRRGLGADADDFVSQTFVGNKYADLDAGSIVTKALGADGAAKLAMKRATMATLVEQLVRRRVPELSFGQ